MVFNFCHWKSDQVKLCVVFFPKNSNVLGSDRELVGSSLLFLLELTLKLANITISPETNKSVIASLHYTKTP